MASQSLHITSFDYLRGYLKDIENCETFNTISEVKTKMEQVGESIDQNTLK